MNSWIARTKWLVWCLCIHTSWPSHLMGIWYLLPIHLLVSWLVPVAGRAHGWIQQLTRLATQACLIVSRSCREWPVHSLVFVSQFFLWPSRNQLTFLNDILKNSLWKEFCDGSHDQTRPVYTARLLQIVVLGVLWVWWKCFIQCHCFVSSLYEIYISLLKNTFSNAWILLPRSASRIHVSHLWGRTSTTKRTCQSILHGKPEVMAAPDLSSLAIVAVARWSWEKCSLSNILFSNSRMITGQIWPFYAWHSITFTTVELKSVTHKTHHTHINWRRLHYTTHPQIHCATTLNGNLYVCIKLQNSVWCEGDKELCDSTNWDDTMNRCHSQSRKRVWIKYLEF